MAEIELSTVSIGEIMPFENKEPGFEGDTVREAFEKFNSNFQAIEEGWSSAGGGGSGGGGPGDGGYIDANPDYTQFFAGDSLYGYTVVNGTGTVNIEKGTMEWIAGNESYVYKNGSAIDGKRYTHLVVEIERKSGALVLVQKASTKSPGHNYDFVNYAVNPIGVPPIAMPIGNRVLLIFKMEDAADWLSGTTTGIAFKVSSDSGVFTIHSIRMVGPDSSLVQLAVTQAEIAAAQSEAQAALASANAQLAETRAQAAETAKQAAELFKNQSEGFKNQAQDYAVDASEYSEKSAYEALMSTAAARFSLYLEPNPNASWDFSKGGIQSWTSVNANLSNVGGKLRVSHTDLDGQVISPFSIGASGVVYNKVVIKVNVISGSFTDFTQCRLFYNTTSRQTFNADYYITPIGWENLELNANNNVYLMFDASITNAPSNDWLTNVIRQLRFDLANANPLVYDIEYVYLLGTDTAFPYKQAQAAATSAAQAGTSETEASQYATAAQNSATAAQTSESNANTFAQQASTAVTTAQGAATTATNAAGAAAASQSAAGNSASDAQSYMTQAATSASNAAGSEAAAAQSAVVAARVSPGIPVTLNPVFGDWTGPLPKGWAVAAGSSVNVIKNTANAIYSAYCIQLNAPDGNNFYLEARTDSNPSSIQNVDVTYYAIEVDLDLISGNLEGSGIVFDKVYTDGTSTRLILNSTDFVKVGTTKYTFNSLKPIETTNGKTLSYMRVFMVANLTLMTGTKAAKTIRFNKINIRSASSQEIASGGINGEVQAAITQEAEARVAADGEINSKYTVKINNNGYISGYGLIANTNNGATVSDMIFLVDNFKVVAPSGGGSAQTPKQMFSVGNVNGTPTLVMNGNMLADGAISARSLLVGIGGNLIDNSDLAAGTDYFILSAWGSGTDPRTLIKRNDNYAPPSGALQIYQSGNNQDSWSDILLAQANGNIRYIDVVPGKKYEFSVYSYSHRANIEAFIGFFDAAGNNISYSSSGVFAPQNGNPDYNLANYRRIGVFATAPANARKAYIIMRKQPTGTTSGWGDSYAWFARPYFGEATDFQTEFTPWSLGGATLIRGSSIVTGSITADRLSVTNLSAISANLGAITAGSINVNNKFVMGNDGTITIRSSVTGARLEITSSYILMVDNT